MDTGAARSGGGGETGSGNVGASGIPSPLMHVQHMRSHDHYTMKFAGTTWLQSSNDGVADNLWSNFPWEWPAMFVRSDQGMELFSSHLYWRAKGINIEFKNPVCVQNIGTTAAGLEATGQNLQAQLFSYLDTNWITGVTTSPAGRGYTEAVANTLVGSWDNHGYTAGATTLLTTVDLPATALTPSYPDVKNCGMGPGQSLKHGWSIHDKYWRSTKELLGFDMAANSNQAPAWDERWGMIGDPFIGATTRFSANVNLATARVNFAVPGSVAATATQLSVPPYRSAEPIPALYLTLQPQLSGLNAGTGEARCQLQWEMSVDIELTGRVPRITSGVGFQAGLITASSYQYADQVNANYAKAIRCVPIFTPGGDA